MSLQQFLELADCRVGPTQLVCFVFWFFWIGCRYQCK